MQGVARLKDSRVRDEFVSLCRDYAPNLSLDRPSFLILVDLFRVCLREGNNTGSYRCVRTIFSVCYQYAMNVGGTVFFVGRQLQSHEAWRNLSFWTFSAEELIRYDVMRGSYWLQKNTTAAVSPRVFPFEDTLVVALITILRLQAIVFNSMRQVRVPADVVLEFIHIQADLYGFSQSNIDLLRRPAADFVAWLQDATILEMKSELIQFIDSGKESVINGTNDNAASAEAPREWKNIGSLSYDLGYCPMIELIHRLLMKRANASPSSTVNELQQKPGVMNGNSPKPVSYCLCGRPAGLWNAIGTFSTSPTASVLSRKLMRHVVCELCYRRLVHSDSIPITTHQIVCMGACPVPSSWQGNFPYSFLSVFFGDFDTNQSDDEKALKVKADVLNIAFVRFMRDVLVERSDGGIVNGVVPRLMSSSAIAKQLATDAKELTSMGIGSAISFGRSSSNASDQPMSRASTRTDSSVGSDSGSNVGTDLMPSPRSLPSKDSVASDIRDKKKSKVMSAKDSINVQRERQYVVSLFLSLKLIIMAECEIIN
jgi:hypothetical protein